VNGSFAKEKWRVRAFLRGRETESGHNASVRQVIANGRMTYEGDFIKMGNMAKGFDQIV